MLFLNTIVIEIMFKWKDLLPKHDTSEFSVDVFVVVHIIIYSKQQTHTNKAETIPDLKMFLFSDIYIGLKKIHDCTFLINDLYTRDTSKKI